ncbi:hypothetical protein, partial [Marivirga sp.]|uniref:hypothetical protein n=1 Tax=Marivirga sp. TaxID=2018662 RepID=UPI002D7E6973
MYRQVIVFLFFTHLTLQHAFAQNTIISDSVTLEAVEVKGFSNGEEITRQAAAIAYLSPKQTSQLSFNNPVMAWSSLPGVSLEQ